LYQGTDEHVIRLEAALAGSDSGVSQHRICGVSSGRSLTLAGVGEVLDNPLGRTGIGIAGGGTAREECSALGTQGILT
jgi:hypothetical protein